jgi:hypothetical protein
MRLECSPLLSSRLYIYGISPVQYNVLAVQALQSALGSDQGLASIPGFSEAGLFPVYMHGTNGQMFDWADSSPTSYCTSACPTLPYQAHA